MTTTTQTPDQRLRLPELAEYRAKVAKRHAAAFCEVPDYVMGCEVLPLTPRTMSMLIASDNRFATGGKPTVDDVLNFLWFHSRLYVHAGDPKWRQRKAKALRPLTRQLAQPWRKWIGLKADVTRQAAVVFLAITEINDLIETTFAAAIRGGNGPIIATLEAHVINALAREYHWPLGAIVNLPLAQIFQLDRCLSRTKEDEGERELVAAHLRRRFAAMMKDKEAAHG